MKAEEFGANALYKTDHINAIPVDDRNASQANDGHQHKVVGGSIFESATVQAAMAATTTRP